MNILRSTVIGLILITVFIPLFGSVGAQSPILCPMGLPTRLIPSESGRITAKDGVMLYEMPTFTSNEIVLIETDTEFIAWYGPSCTDNAVWWLVDANDTFGWFAESAASAGGDEETVYLVEPTGRSAQDVLPIPSNTDDEPYPQDLLGLNFLLSANIATEVTAQWVLLNEQDDNFTRYEHPLFREVRFPIYQGNEWGDFPTIRVHRTADWETISHPLDELRLLLEEPIESPYLTALPDVNAGKMFQASSIYLDFQNGSGIRGLTHYSQFGGPPGDGELIYLFTGLTEDQTYLVQIAFPLDSAMLPDSDAISRQFNYEAYPPFPSSDRIFQHSLVMMLEAAPDALTSPRLSDLDALAASLFIGDALPLCADMPPCFDGAHCQDCDEG